MASFSDISVFYTFIAIVVSIGLVVEMGLFETVEIRAEIVTLLTKANGVKWTDSE